MDVPSLAEVLKTIRGERTQTEMADLLMTHMEPRERPLSKQHLHHYESGAVRPPDEIIDAYAAVAPEQAANLLRGTGLVRAVDAIRNQSEEAA